MHSLSRRHLVMLVFITLVWGVNWPIMKLGVTGFPPLSFRALSMWLGLPVLGAVLVAMKIPFFVPRDRWLDLCKLAMTNMVGWHVLAILSLPMLSSGRAAILGYTMPIFGAVLGAFFFGQQLAARAWGGIAAAALGVVLLLWHEITNLTGRPVGVLMMLTAAVIWAVGTHQMRRTTLPVPTLTISFWMTTVATVVMTVLAVLTERGAWAMPDKTTSLAIAYNSVFIFGFAQAAWFVLARSLPPVASSLSVMFIPVLGVFTGAIFLGEVLHWQDWVAIALVVVAIASVLLPSRSSKAAMESKEIAG